jgi:hypothetical protein
MFRAAQPHHDGIQERRRAGTRNLISARKMKGELSRRPLE